MPFCFICKIMLWCKCIHLATAITLKLISTTTQFRLKKSHICKEQVTSMLLGNAGFTAVCDRHCTIYLAFRTETFSLQVSVLWLPFLHFPSPSKSLVTLILFSVFVSSVFLWLYIQVRLHIFIFLWTLGLIIVVVYGKFCFSFLWTKWFSYTIYVTFL